jgi:hypothetical protein
VRKLLVGLLSALAALTISGQLPGQLAGQHTRQLTGQLAGGQAQGEVAATAGILPSCQVAAPQITGPVPSLLDTELPDGTVVFGGSHVKAGKLVTVLHAVLPNCQPAPGFGVHGTATVALPVHSTQAVIDVIEANAGGEVILGGGIGPYLVVGRLLADGRVDTGFGNSGWDRLQVPVKPPNGFFSGYAVNSLAFGPSGTLYLGGNDGTAHCCVEDFVGALSPSGSVERSFGDDGWAIVPALGGSYETEIFPGASGILVMGFVMFTGCGGPVLARLDARGRPDETFDASVRHTLLEATTARYVFVGTALYPRTGGGFALVGDLTPSGCGPTVPKLAGKGLALGFLRNGDIDTSFGTAGRTAFAYDGSEGTWAVPLLDGSTVVVTEQVPPGDYGAPRSLKVRELSTAGRFNTALCSSGTCTIDLTWASAANSYPAIDAMAAPGGPVVIVVAAKGRAEIYRVGL